MLWGRTRGAVTLFIGLKLFSEQLVKRRRAADHGRVFQRENETRIQGKDVVSDNL